MENTHHISELIRRVNDNHSQAAMRQYLDNGVHLAFQMSRMAIDALNEAAEALATGQISPRFDELVFAKTFHDTLANEPAIRYESCELPSTPSDGDEDEPQPFDEEIDAAAFDALVALSDDDLLERLTFKYDCYPFTFHQKHTDDAKMQQDFYNAAMGYFRSAARLAASLASESARDWLEAVRLLTPRTKPLGAAYGFVKGMSLTADDIAQAYAAAQSAQARLWVDAELANLGGE